METLLVECAVFLTESLVVLNQAQIDKGSSVIEINPIRNTMKDYLERTEALRGYL